MTKVINTISCWQKLRNEIQTKKIGFVPTMGHFHRGHLQLIEKSLAENECSVVSLFVNPMQFNQEEDYQNYPKTFEQDLKMLEDLGVDYLFAPSKEEMYPEGFLYTMSESKYSRGMEGEYRPGHLEGVLTIVMKLFCLIKPSKAYFGEKDYQQLKIVQGMSKAFFMDVEVIGLPTVRQEEGLALSSRNSRLSIQEKEKAIRFPALLQDFTKNCEVVAQELEKEGLKVDYIKEAYGRRFGAVFIGKVRLIDNVQIQ